MKSILHTTSNTRPVTSDEKILRSDALVNLDEQDIEILKFGGIRTILDFRSVRETDELPNSLKDHQDFTYYHFPILAGGSIPKSADEFPSIYMTIADDSQMTDIFRLIAEAEEGVLYHCTAGKDRTGVVSAILHLLGGWSEEQVVADYMITKEMTAAVAAWIEQQHPEIDINLVIPQEMHMKKFLKAFLNKYKTAENYLHQIGLSDSDIVRLQSKMK